MSDLKQTGNEVIRTIKNPRIQVAALGATVGIVGTALGQKALFTQFRDIFGWETENGVFRQVDPLTGRPTRDVVPEVSRMFNLRRQAARFGLALLALGSLALVKGDSPAAEGVRMGLIASAGTLLAHGIQDNVQALNP